MADKPSTPRVTSPIYHSINQTSRLRSRRWLNVGIILAVVVAVIAGSLLVKGHKNKGQLSAEQAVRLVYLNTVQGKGQATLADNTGKVLAHAPAPVNAYASYEALSPDGSALVSFGSPDPRESFTMVGGNQSVTADSQKALRTADYQGGSHNIVFINDSTVLYTSCPPKTTCKVIALNLARGKTYQVADTGLRSQGSSAYCYLLGKDDNGTSVYLRVNGQNDLGRSSSAIYQINAFHGNVIRTIPVPVYAGYDSSLSPGGKTLAFSGGKAENGKVQAIVYLLDIDSGRQTSVTWPKAGVGGVAGKLKWSPDGKKILMRTTAVNVQAGAKQTSPPALLAYLDTSTDQITNLLTISDTQSNEVAGSGWLDSSHIVYDQLAGAKNTVYKLDISTKTSAPLENSHGQLLEAAF